MNQSFNFVLLFLCLLSIQPAFAFGPVTPHPGYYQRIEEERVQRMQEAQAAREAENDRIARANQTRLNEFNEKMSTVTTAIDLCLNRITQDNTRDAIGSYYEVSHLFEDVKQCSTRYGIPENSDFSILKQKVESLAGDMVPVLRSDTHRNALAFIVKYQDEIRQSEEFWRQFNSASERRDFQKAKEAFESYRKVVGIYGSLYRHQIFGYKGDCGLFKPCLIQDGPIIVDRIQEMTLGLDTILERAAQARFSEDPHIVAAQAEIDARDSFDAHVAAAQGALNALVASSRDPLNAQLASDRDTAAQVALDAQIASTRATVYAQTTRETAAHASDRVQLELLIGELRDGYIEELNAYRSTVIALCIRLGINLPSGF